MKAIPRTAAAAAAAGLSRSLSTTCRRSPVPDCRAGQRRNQRRKNSGSSTTAENFDARASPIPATARTRCRPPPPASQNRHKKENAMIVKQARATASLAIVDDLPPRRPQRNQPSRWRRVGQAMRPVQDA